MYLSARGLVPPALNIFRKGGVCVCLSVHARARVYERRVWYGCCGAKVSLPATHHEPSAAHKTHLSALVGKANRWAPIMAILRPLTSNSVVWLVMEEE